MSDLQSAYDKRKTMFIEARAKTQQEIERFFESIKDIPPEVLTGIDIPQDTRIEAIVPSLYKEPLDPDKYTEEINAFKALYTTIMQRVEEVNKEAMECLKDYM